MQKSVLIQCIASLWVTILAIGCQAQRKRDFSSEIESLTPDEQKVLAEIILDTGKRSVPLPMTENTDERATVISGKVEVGVPFNLTKALLDKATKVLPPDKVSKLRGLKAKASIAAKVEVKYQRFYQFVYRIHADKRTEYDKIFKTSTLPDGTETRSFIAEFVNSRDHAIYCETGIKFESMKGLDADFDILSLSTGAKIQLGDEIGVGQYSGGFKIRENYPIQFYKDVCRMYSESMDEILTKEFKVSVAETLRESLMVPSPSACVVPVDDPTYRQVHDIDADVDFATYRAEHDDPGCEYILGISELLSENRRIGRCVSEIGSPLGHCERRSRQDSLCNVYLRPDGTITSDRNEVEASRQFAFDFPDCDEAANSKCAPLTLTDSLQRIRPFFLDSGVFSWLVYASTDAKIKVGVCK
jgi:hypothetical protein